MLGGRTLTTIRPTYPLKTFPFPFRFAGRVNDPESAVAREQPTRTAGSEVDEYEEPLVLRIIRTCSPAIVPPLRQR